MRLKRTGERLEAIMRLLPKTKTLADIGCDHGYMGQEALKRGKAERLLACDLRREPLKKAEKNLEEEIRAGKAELRLGSGLQPLKDGEADLALISGMGGRTIAEILSLDKARTRSIPLFLLSPQSELFLVYEALEKLGIGIREEVYTEEKGKIYPLILAERDVSFPEEDRRLPVFSKEYGRLALRRGDSVLLQKIEADREEKERLLTLPLTEERRGEILQWMKEYKTQKERREDESKRYLCED